MSRPRVVVADFQRGAMDLEQKILGDLADVEALAVSSEEQLWGRIEDAAAGMVYHTLKGTSATIGRLQKWRPRLRRAGVVDDVRSTWPPPRGMPVANVRDYGNEEVAASAIGLLLALTRGIAF